ncbi:MAG: hypothetical protein K2W78_09070 [Xanthobacteraceae bacterium]|nr:hypothetical protein [Xanthobacteraceae bacterium]
MTATSSRDFGQEPLRKDTEREQNKAVVKDADKTDSKDRDNVHGDGKSLGLDDRQTGSSHRD